MQPLLLPACVEACKKYQAISITKDAAENGIDINQYKNVAVFIEQREEKSPVFLMKCLERTQAGRCAWGKTYRSSSWPWDAQPGG